MSLWLTACAGNLNTLLAAAAEHGALVEVDMEHSSVGRDTLGTYRALLPRKLKPAEVLQRMG